MELNQKENLIVQSILNFMLFNGLRINRFFESDYFEEVDFDSEIKLLLKKIEIDNQARLLTALYELLVVPRECLEDLFKDDFNNLNKKIRTIVIEESSSYKGEEDEIQYTRHIRNAVAHANVSFSPGNYVEFIDQYLVGQEVKAECRIRIPLCGLEVLMGELLKIGIKYIKSLSNK